MRSRVLPLVLSVAALASAAVATPPAGATERSAIPELDWRDCEDGFQCATAEVPRDYAAPRGPKLRLALIRRPAVDREHRIGSLFLNPGGPGGSGVAFVREAPAIAFQLLPRFDWIGFDPRGVGASEPAVDCEEEEPFDPMMPDTFELRTLLERGRMLSRLCLNRDPAFLAGLNTANAARDLDLLRAAVGDEQLSYLGLSWGGMLGATYASLFPGRARALLLDSPVDGDVWLNQPFDASTEQTVGFEASLDRFFSACASDRETCRFGSGRDPEDAFDELLARLDATPLDVGDGRTVDGHDVRAIAADSMYSKRRWRPLAAALEAAEAGDGAAVREFIDGVIDEDYDLLYDVFSTYLSVERRYPHRLAPYLQYADHLFALSPHFAFGAYESVSERFWPVRARGAFYGPYRHASNATPALVMHTTHDPATPYEWGKRVVRDLGNARLLTYRGDGHGVVTDLNPCVLAALVPYLEDGTLPPRGAACDQHVPFGAQTAAAARAGDASPRWRAR